MKKNICIGIGGFLGAVLRYSVKQIHLFSLKGTMPLNTLMINIIGSFILVLIFTISYETIKLNENIKCGITTGFLGAFTTFSTMCREIFKLLNNGVYYLGIIYPFLSIILGIGAAYLGNVLAKNIEKKLVYREDKKIETCIGYDLQEGSEC